MLTKQTPTKSNQNKNQQTKNKFYTKSSTNLNTKKYFLTQRWYYFKAKDTNTIQENYEMSVGVEGGSRIVQDDKIEFITEIQGWVNIQKSISREMVAHTCNPSYLGG
jgi:hypothetical protein